MIRAFAILIAAILSFPALAEPECLPRDQILKVALERYREVPVAAGLGTRGHILEILASPEGSYTLLLVRPADGLACVIDAGEGWGFVVTKKGSF